MQLVNHRKVTFTFIAEFSARMFHIIMQARAKYLDSVSACDCIKKDSKVSAVIKKNFCCYQKLTKRGKNKVSRDKTHRFPGRTQFTSSCYRLFRYRYEGQL